MTNYVRGQTHNFYAQFYEFEGGPGVNVPNLELEVIRTSDAVSVIGPTSTGIVNLALGSYTYAWAIPDSAETTDYLFVWSGTVSGEAVSATETIGVVAANSGTGTAPCDTWPVRWSCDLSVGAAAVTGAALQAATEVLWSLSGRRFGLCTVTLRPCKRTCSDVPWPNTLWPSVQPGWTYPMPVNMGGGEWLNLTCGSCVRDCSCVTLEEVLLPGPVYDIVQVKVDGDVLDSDAYRLDNSRILVRVDGGSWPRCNNLNLTDTEEDTWSVTARYGEDVPVIGQMAVGELACEFVKYMLGEDCALPQPIQSLSRQGVNITYVDPGELLANGRLGLRFSDMFIQTVNPGGLRARARFYDVDGPRARLVGQ